MSKVRLEAMLDHCGVHLSVPATGRIGTKPDAAIFGRRVHPEITQLGIAPRNSSPTGSSPRSISGNSCWANRRTDSRSAN